MKQNLTSNDIKLVPELFAITKAIFIKRNNFDYQPVILHYRSFQNYWHNGLKIAHLCHIDEPSLHSLTRSQQSIFKMGMMVAIFGVKKSPI